MGYMKSLDVDAQEAYGAAFAVLHEDSDEQPHEGLARRLERLGWIAPTTARAIWDKAGTAYGQAAIKDAGRYVLDPLHEILAILDPTNLPGAR
jgi:hypothetical protein